jgi:large subunit ribosomal protein L30
MAIIRIKQTKSKIGSTQRQKDTLQALGLRKMNAIVEHEDNKQIMGMIQKVAHLVTVEKVK